MIRLKTLLKFGLPFALWCYIFRDFLFGNLLISEDTFGIYAVLKYHLTNIKLGILPQWNPYVHWGMGQLAQAGEMNPVWLIMLLFNCSGVDVYHAYVWTLAIYVFISSIGLYCLLGNLFKEKYLAYFGFLLFLFSSNTMMVFTQATLILIFLPAIWFCFFITDFFQTKRPSSVLWLGFLSTLIITTYIPFYFMVTMMCVLLLSVIFYLDVLKKFGLHLLDFCLNHSKVLFFSVLAAVLGVYVAFLNWQFVNSDLLVLARPSVMTYAFAKDAGIPIGEILRDPSIFNLMVRSLQSPCLDYSSDIFSLANILFNNQRVFYIPLLAHVILFISFFLRLDRRSLFWGMGCFILFLIGVARLTPIYSILFTYVPFFKMFRNIFFLSPFITVLYIIFMLELFRQLWFNPSRINRKILAGVVVTIGLFILLWNPPGALKWGFFATMGGMLLILVLRFLGVLSAFGRLPMILLSLLILVQPVQIFSLYVHQFKKMEKSSILSKSSRVPLDSPQFSYIRPGLDSEDLIPREDNETYRLFNWHIIAMKDAVGFFTMNYGYPTTWSSAIANLPVPIPGFKEYVRHKFVVYDSFDADRRFSSVADFSKQFPLQTVNAFIDGPGKGIEMKRFNANELSLETNFSSVKFLVYNDSFHPGWKAYINGKETRLYRANYAFKGVWVPAGVQRVDFIFKLPFATWGFILLVLFYIYFIICIVASFKQGVSGRADV